MPEGFFHGSVVASSKAPPSLVPKCGACGLYKGCLSPKMPVRGNGKRGVLIVGEAPGAQEDERGMPFVGKSGQFLTETLEDLGVELFEDCWVTNSLICRPPDNETPDENKINYCRPNLMKAVRELQPKTIVLIGGIAVKSLIGGLWKYGDTDVGGITRWAGFNIPCQKPNVWICPTYHPSFLMREHSEVLDRMFVQHLRAAFEHTAPPWEAPPDYKKQVEVVMDVDEAARILRRMIEKGGPCAVDYENNCLKPETKGAKIICCSVCWQGKKTIAYPWHGAAIEATKELLWSERVQKIASNLKHEERWTRWAFGKGVRSWMHDTMVAAHVLDNRPGITGLKFQAFAHLGEEAYDEHISQFLRTSGDEKINRVASEVDLRQLLEYCGADTVLEYYLAEAQIKILGTK